jgi:hypothetical protein
MKTILQASIFHHFAVMNNDAQRLARRRSLFEPVTCKLMTFIIYDGHWNGAARSSLDVRNRRIRRNGHVAWSGDRP